MVMIKSFGAGACIWCSKEKEGVELESDEVLGQEKAWQKAHVESQK